MIQEKTLENRKKNDSNDRSKITCRKSTRKKFQDIDDGKKIRKKTRRRFQ